MYKEVKKGGDTQCYTLLLDTPSQVMTVCDTQDLLRIVFCELVLEED